MYEALIQQTEEALDRTSKWVETGWTVRFGPRAVVVGSLKEAMALPRTAVYREEARNYWRQVALTADDTSVYGHKALEALRAGDMRQAADALYFAQYMEKPISEQSRTWQPLYEAAMEEAAICC
ncbi:MAG: hypothetical protein K9I59_02235 [Chlorobium sp.]|jgi:hypothetical protein|uniref:hypothetical protein n=1 Tax=Chlorobium sp. TaxID=1095 RepID=UPI001D4FF8EA|nr:hypothetical protein [Chlorobium sp.]MBN1279972.1 hypothetical protein [Chlorobiaceae bacterium]MCF8215672.1 hypothetical protein [Chlorobium sp.]MCF8271915.1 hypothetical protein [Chlorobium sp.]MCF8286881.1 hypothetical protein [Chlorobium sp.]MCF8291862.1 hypothetical protein [Chlorobium sp.]